MEIIFKFDFEPGELKATINIELEMLKSIIESTQLGIDKIVLTSNLDEDIKNLYGLSPYVSKRKVGNSYVDVVAKYCNAEKESILFITSQLLNYQDFKIRFYIYLHELMHAQNEKVLQKLGEARYPGDIRNQHLSTLYDEYTADRKALKLLEEIYPDYSEAWEDFKTTTVIGLAKIINDTTNYQFITDKLEDFTKTGDANRFLSEIMLLVDDLSTSIVRIQAFFDQYQRLSNGLDISKSKFVNDKSGSLMAFFQERFLSEDQSLEGGLPLITEFHSNFGFRFEERVSCLWCYPVEI